MTGSIGQKSGAAYRSDIDGLRAIAILSVVLFHAGVPFFSGGFVGVDIFFVISGYLITLWIKNNLVAGTFSFRKFYLNRLRRLAPSFFVVLTFVCTAGFFLEGEAALINLAKTLASSLAFTSNWFFLGQTGYFDPALESNALLHSWSLSVEEQFYLAWPLALFMLRGHLNGTSRKLVDIVFGLFGLSLMVSVLLAGQATAQQAFFNSSGRMWELLAGAALALGLVGQSTTKNIATGMRCVGVALIIFSIGFYSRKIAYPGMAALAPVIGSFLVIAATPEFRDPVFNVLASTPFRFVGKISYSLYLWHWPLLVFAKALHPGLSTFALIMVLAVAVLLATASTYLFETPIRQRRLFKHDRPFVATAGLVSVIFIGLSIQTIRSDGYPQRWEDGSFSETTDDLYKGFNRGTCFIEREPLSNLTATCLTPNATRKNILIIGDSFAAHLMPGLVHYFPEYHFAQATAAGCRALVNFFYYGEMHCPELNKLLFSSTISDQRYDAIILASDWLYGDQVGDTLATIKAHTSAQIIVFGNTPVYKNNPSDGLKKNVMTGLPMAMEQPPFRENLWETNNEIKAGAQSDKFIPLLENFCPNKICPLVTKEGKNVHFDWGHLTAWGSVAVIAASRDQILNALPKSISLH